MSGLMRRLFRVRGLFFEADDAPIFIGFDYTEFQGGLLDENLNGGYGHVGAGLDMLPEHAAVIHFVDVIAGQDEDVFGAFAADGINILVHGVGGALIPLLGDAHLRRKDFDIFAETGEGRPTGANVAVEAECFVLGEYEDAAQIGVDAVGKGDVDDAVEAAQGDRRLGAVTRQRPQAFTLASGEKDADGVAHIGHGRTPG